MKKEGFSSSHYELIKVAPATAIILGVPWYFGFLDLIFFVLFATVCFYLFVWKHEIFKGFREVVIKQLKERGNTPQELRHKVVGGADYQFHFHVDRHWIRLDFTRRRCTFIRRFLDLGVV
jgi:hypothetical protein